MSSVKKVAFSFTYPVRPTDVVTLSVRIGNAQVGASVARLDDRDPPICPPGSIVDVPVGTGQELIGRTLVVRTLVADINPHSNSSVVLLDLNGSAPGNELRASADVEADGGAVYYTSTVGFTQA